MPDMCLGVSQGDSLSFKRRQKEGRVKYQRKAWLAQIMEDPGCQDEELVLHRQSGGTGPLLVQRWSLRSSNCSCT